MLRILKWIGIVSLLIILMVGYMYISAIRSNEWLDHLFLELRQGWNAEVIIHNIKEPSKEPNYAQKLQLALNNLKKAHLEKFTSAECTHGPRYDTNEGLDFRSKCFIWGKFDKKVVQFEFELKGFWEQWKIINFDFGVIEPVNL